MTYALEITRDAVKSLKSIPPKDRARIYDRLERLAADPFAATAVIKMQGQDGYRMRVGDYRVVYLVEGERLVIIVVAVGHRREVYR